MGRLGRPEFVIVVAIGAVYVGFWALVIIVLLRALGWLIRRDR